MKKIDVSTPKFPELFALVDDEDFDRLNQFKWTATMPHNILYAIRSTIVEGRKTTIRMHREIIGGDLEVDHRDGNGLNNQKSNLRSVTPAQNQQNRKRSRGSSVYKGVSWHKSIGKWRATIVVCGKQKSLGYFKEEIPAAKAYDAAAKETFGEYASVNFHE